MWPRLLIISLLFGFLWTLQASLLFHFNAIAYSLNLIFVLYYLIVFFQEPRKHKYGIFSAIVAGFFLDILSLSYLGTSIVSLLVIAFISKYILFSLKKPKGEYPISYFIPLFILSFFMSYLLTFAIDYFLHPISTAPFIRKTLLMDITYNTIIAVFGFYIFKKFRQSRERQ